ncbi:hypothetical protein BJ508DRAFT_351209 [Ascobolus immersus RN42]|uniref:Uncharacterized protein n=1 Tax=Ascobolus immersus RN42 TaxID=1160509 RepID=A0A3N4HT77_ASCIM|nr:hypothetical protein BJ508DRAFT_351209 [Ascobolus immersus RN42]
MGDENFSQGIPWSEKFRGTTTPNFIRLLILFLAITSITLFLKKYDPTMSSLAPQSAPLVPISTVCGIIYQTSSTEAVSIRVDAVDQIQVFTDEVSYQQALENFRTVTETKTITHDKPPSTVSPAEDKTTTVTATPAPKEASTVTVEKVVFSPVTRISTTTLFQVGFNKQAAIETVFVPTNPQSLPSVRVGDNLTIQGNNVNIVTPTPTMLEKYMNGFVTFTSVLGIGCLMTFSYIGIKTLSAVRVAGQASQYQVLGSAMEVGQAGVEAGIEAFN